VSTQAGNHRGTSKQDYATPPDFIAAVTRRNALLWLRSVAAKPLGHPTLNRNGVAAAACEIRLAIHLGTAPSSSALAWLRELCSANDIEIRAQARNAVLAVGQ